METVKVKRSGYYGKDEQETTINFEYDDRTSWRIFSTYPPHIRKIMQIGRVLRIEVDPDGRTILVDAVLDANQIRLFKQK